MSDTRGSRLQCPSCGNPSRDGGLCEAEGTQLLRVLQDAPWILAQMNVTVARTDVHTRQKARGGLETPLPINLKAADLRAGFNTLLVSWALACGGEDDPTLQGGGSQAARWLLARFNQVRRHEAADCIVDELKRQAMACERVIDRRIDPDYLGDCSAPTDSGRCATPLRVMPGIQEVTCWRCFHPYDVSDLRAERDERIDGCLATVKEIAQFKFELIPGRKMTPKMIEGYIRRKDIPSHGKHHRNGAYLYRIGDIRAAAQEALGVKAA